MNLESLLFLAVGNSDFITKGLIVMPHIYRLYMQLKLPQAVIHIGAALLYQNGKDVSSTMRFYIFFSNILLLVLPCLSLRIIIFC